MVPAQAAAGAVVAAATGRPLGSACGPAGTGGSDWVFVAIAAVAAVAWLAAPNPGGTPALGGVPGAVAAGTAPAGSSRGPGMTGQIFGIDGLCLDSTDGGGANGNRVTLATCHGASPQQQWTLLADKEIVVNGRCLGVDQDSATRASLSGCMPAPGPRVRWEVGSDRTIRERRFPASALAAGTTTAPTAPSSRWPPCKPNYKAQTWTVPNTALNPPGVAMPVGNMPGWRQVFTDDFGENVPSGTSPRRCRASGATI